MRKESIIKLSQRNNKGDKMKVQFKASVIKFTNLEESKNNHISISGNRATHIDEEIGTYYNSDLNLLKATIESMFGMEFDHDQNVSYHSIDENEWIEPECDEAFHVFYTKVTSEDVNLD